MMGKKSTLCAFAFIAAFFVTGCGETPLSVVELRCGDTDILAEVYQNRLEAIVGEHSLTLYQVEAASGAKYSDETVVLWNKGENWMLIMDEDTDAEKMFDCIER